MKPTDHRAALVEQARAYLDASGHPRRAMGGILAVAGAAGVLASFALFLVGIDRMSIRYPLAVTAAYATFFGLLRLRLRHQAPATRPQTDDPEGLFASGLAGVGLATSVEKLATAVPIGEPAEADRPSRRSILDGWDGSGLDAVGEGCGPLVVLVLIAGLCAAVVSIYLVAVSPLLLAELLVDGAVLGAIARAVPSGPVPHWSRAVVRRTWLAALVTIVVFGLVGLGFERIAPGARTLGEAWSTKRP